MKAAIPPIFFLLLLVTGGCNFFSQSPKSDERVVARVYDKYLYQSDLTGVGTGAATVDDSLAAVRNYVDTWIRHHVLLRYAQDNLPEEEQQLNDRLRDYKESLLIYLYENELVKQKLDTVISEQAIQEYYTQHREVFKLKEDIIKMRLVVLPATAAVRLDSVRVWLKKPDDYNRPQLLGFCKENAVTYRIETDQWYNKEEMTTLLPVNRFNLMAVLSARSYIEVADSGYGYLMKFDDFKATGSDAPMEYVKDEITGILINRKKIEFIQRIHQSIYDEAMKAGSFEIVDEMVRPGSPEQ
jgi:hypothetical protein